VPLLVFPQEPNTLIGIYNETIAVTCSVLTSDDLRLVSWPAPEFAGERFASTLWLKLRVLHLDSISRWLQTQFAFKTFSAYVCWLMSQTCVKTNAK